MISGNKKSVLLQALDIFALWNLAVAHPLYQVLAAAPEFFVAHRATTIDFALLTLVISVVVPAVLVGLVGIARRVSSLAGDALQILIVGVVCILVVLQVERRVGPAGAASMLTVAAVIGIAVAVAYWRVTSVQTFTRFLAPAVVLVPVVFLASPALRPIAFPGAARSSAPVAPAKTPSIVLVVFDQLPLASLLDSNTRIDRRLYPAFANLAAEATWFRNATAVADSTGVALPPIFTGIYPQRDATPTAADHPNSLFTMLAGTYVFKVFEPITTLCPESICPREREPFDRRLTSMTADAALVYLHIVAPRRFASVLPPVSQSWNNFSMGSEWLERWAVDRDQDRRLEPNRFINSIEPAGARPTFYVLHTLFPHEPYVYTRSGQTFAPGGSLPGLDTNEVWTRDEWTVTQNYQAHLIQIGYADALLGQILDRLKKSGVFDDSLIVVTADHGARFHPREPFKLMATRHASDIMSVPLLVKLPGQRVGVVNDRNAETVDVAPTIAAALGAELPWKHDGIDLLDPHAPDRARKAVFMYGAIQVMRLGNTVLDDLRASVARKMSLFENGDPYMLTRAPYPALVGRRVADLHIGPAWEHPVVLHDADRLTQVNTSGDTLPARVTGAVWHESGLTDPLPIAIALNGIIRATTWAVGTNGEWSALVPVESFRSGQNDVQLFVIRDVQGAIDLRTASATRAPAVNLISSVAMNVWTVRQSGLYDAESDGAMSFRWTNGAAHLDFPMDRDSPPRAVNVDIALTGPQGARLRILLNGCELYTGHIKGRWSQTLGFGSCVLNGPRATIDVLSDTFQPSRDERRLGVAIGSVTLTAAR